MLIKEDGTVVTKTSETPPNVSKETVTESTSNKRQMLIDQAKLRSSKLSGTRAHLQALIQKKMRLEIEIKGLVRSLQKMQKTQRKTLTEVFGLDPQDPEIEEKLSSLISEDAELAHAIQEGDDLIRKIAVNLEDATFDVQPEIEKLLNKASQK